MESMSSTTPSLTYYENTSDSLGSTENKSFEVNKIKNISVSTSMSKNKSFGVNKIKKSLNKKVMKIFTGKHGTKQREEKKEYIQTDSNNMSAESSLVIINRTEHEVEAQEVTLPSDDEAPEVSASPTAVTDNRTENEASVQARTVIIESESSNLNQGFNRYAAFSICAIGIVSAVIIFRNKIN